MSRKIEAAKIEAGFARKARLPKGTRLPLSNNRQKSAKKLAALHARVSNLRADFTHKLTTRLSRENQTIVIEDLNVKGMVSNHKLARALNDVSFGEIRRQLEYKTKRYSTQLVIADRWYPSSRLCSLCEWKNEMLQLSEREEWTCLSCHAVHDREINAAINLKRLATVTALPVANQLVTEDTAVGKVSTLGGEVTPVRYECGQLDTSGQERNSAHFCAPF